MMKSTTKTAALDSGYVSTMVWKTKQPNKVAHLEAGKKRIKDKISGGDEVKTGDLLPQITSNKEKKD